MFSTLRQDSVLYVIDKNGDMRFSIVHSPKSSAMYPEYKTAIPMPNAPMFVDIEGDDGGSKVAFTKVPATQSSHEYNGIFITESREAAQAELEAMASKSKAHIDSVKYHEGVMAFCDKTLPLVNPTIAKEKENDNRLQSLESQMINMNTVLSEVSEFIKKLKPTQQ